MKILIDLQACQTASRNRGIGRYSLALAQSIARNCGENEVHILLNGDLLSDARFLHESFKELLPKKNIHCFSAPDFPAMKTNSWAFSAAHSIRNEYIARLEPDFVHVSSLFEWWDVPVSIKSPESRYKTSVTLYDLIPLNRPETIPNHPDAKSWYLHQIEELKSAFPIFAISEHAKMEALASLHLAESKIMSIGAGVSELFFQNSPAIQLKAPEFLKKLEIFKPFVLTVGVIEKRKNYPRLIEAWAKLPAAVREAHQLIIACNTVCEETLNEMKSTMKKFSLRPDNILVLKDKNDEDLQILYRNCKLFVMPSLHEGFGLPAAEAMVCGAAAIGSSTTSLPEVLGHEEALFDPLDVEKISAKLNKALTDDAFLQMLRRHSESSSKRFSWNSVAQKVLTAYEASSLQATHPHVTGNKPYRDRMLELLAGISAHASDDELQDAARAVAQNRPTEKRQLLIDVSILAKTDSKTGIQRVVRNISKNISAISPPDFRVRLVKCVENEWKYATEVETRLNLEQADSISDSAVEIFKGDIFLGADLGLEYIAAQREWLEYVKLRGAEVNFIVYDILPALMPQFFHSGIANLFVPWLKEIQTLSDRIVCISETVAHELHQWFCANSRQNAQIPEIRHFHLGADLDARPENVRGKNSSEVNDAKFDGPTFLIVSTIEPRKGHHQLLEAFEQLWNENTPVRLVIIGKGGWNVDELIRKIENHPQLNQRLVWLKHCDDDTLEYWYQNSTALISTSFGEGFGLPLIEAAQRQLPLIVRDIPVYREVAGQHAHYFKSESAFELKNAITEWIQLFNNDQHPKSDQLPWLTWKESALSLISKLGIPTAVIEKQNSVQIPKRLSVEP
jgi:glycosyltransferase involved in cell wall biosynthesis